MGYKKHIKAFLFLIGFGITIRLILIHGSQPAQFWDSASYINFAKYLITQKTLPPVGIRAPGYPLFLILTGSGEYFSWTIRVQQLMGILTACILYLTAYKLTRNLLISIACAILYILSVDLLFMEVTIYSETMASFFLCLFALLIVYANDPTGKNGALFWFFAGLTISLTALIRPILQIVPVIILVMLILNSIVTSKNKSKIKLSNIVLFLLAPLVIIGGYGYFNYRRDGSFRITTGIGFSLLNYVGYPEIYMNLPDEMMHIKNVYLNQAEKYPENNALGWGIMLEAVLEAQKEIDGYIRDWDQTAYIIARDAILSTPKHYLRIWWNVFKEYNSSFVVLYGLYKDHNIPRTMANSQVKPWQFTIVKVVESIWRLATPWIMGAVYIAVPFALLTMLRHREQSKSAISISMLWTVFTASALLNISIEPWPGQIRYRMPWQGIILLLFLVSSYYLFGNLREIVRNSQLITP